MRKLLIDLVPGLLGAVVGGTAGFYVTSWIMHQSPYYTPVIPGAFAGLACGFLSIRNSETRGALCAVIALTAGLVTQWKLLMRRFDTDGSFVDFLTHIQTETPFALILIALGTLLGFWWGREATSPWRERISKLDRK